MDRGSQSPNLQTENSAESMCPLSLVISLTVCLGLTMSVLVTGTFCSVQTQCHMQRAAWSALLGDNEWRCDAICLA